LQQNAAYIKRVGVYLLVATLVVLSACSGDAASSADGDSINDGDVEFVENSELDGDSAEAEIEIDIEVVAPDAPTALTAVAVSARNIRLNWDSYADDAVELCIERSDAGGEYKAMACRPATYGRWLDLALTPLAEYQYRARACNGDKCSDWVESEGIVTPESVLPPFEVTIHTYDDPNEVFLTSLTDVMHQTDFSAMVAIKRDGTVVWEMSYKELCPITEMEPFFDDHTMAIGAYATLRIVDLDGTVTYEYPPDMAHHDFAKLSNGNIIYLIYDLIELREDYTILGDGIHIIDPFTDEIVWEWIGQDHIPLADNNPNDLNNIFYGAGHDWTHSNSLWFDEANNYIYLNVRNLNRIYKIKYPSGEVEWIMGDGGDFGEGIWSHSHDPHYVDPSHILMFDNGLYRPNGEIYSQAIMVEYDAEAGTAGIVWSYREDPDFFSLGMGGVWYTGNGNIAICDGANGRIVEVTEAGEKTFELDFEVLIALYKAVPLDISFFSDWGAPATDYSWPRAEKPAK